MTMIANYYPGDATNHAAVDIIRLVESNGCVGSMPAARRQHIETVEVSGKRDARAVAEARGAKPWNF